MNDSKARERAFHDARFKEAVDPRHRLAKYYAVTAISTALFRQLVAEGAKPGHNFLEYGCGTGGDFAFYKQLGCNVHGIDISSEAIVKAQAQAALHGMVANYSVQDAESTQFPDGTFDLVAGQGILHHLDLERSLSELARITKSTGTCVFSEPLGHNPLINLFRKLTPKLRTPDEHPLVHAAQRIGRGEGRAGGAHPVYQSVSQTDADAWYPGRAPARPRRFRADASVF